jgi:small subunit ribosomal protein S20
MPITRSAKKALRASIKKRAFNARRKELVSKEVKELKKLITSGDKKKAQTLIREVQKTLDKAVKAKTLKKNTASRKISRLVKMVKKLS